MQMYLPAYTYRCLKNKEFWTKRIQWTEEHAKMKNHQTTSAGMIDDKTLLYSMIQGHEAKFKAR